MADVGTLFVRVRPAPGSAAAFVSEASPGVASAGKDLAKVFLGAFAIGGIAKTIETVVKAATSQQSSFAVLNQTVKDAGASNQLYGKSLDAVLGKQALLTGFKTTDLAAAFTTLVSATKNTGEAFKDLGDAENIARARNEDLATAALGVSKAEQGSATALQRSGVIVPQVTAAVENLKKSHEDAIVAGAKFTEQEKQAYAAALVTATAQDKAATRLADLAAIQQRFGGDAATFAQSATGQFDRLDAQLSDVEVSVGNKVIPVLLTGIQDAIGFAKALASPEVLAAVGTYAAIKAGLETVSLAQSAYQAILVKGGAAAAEDASTEAVYTRAILANTEALNLNAAAAERAAAANALVGESAGTGAAAEGIEGAGALVPPAAEEGGFLAGLGALATGPTAIIAGVAAIAGGIAYLATREGITTEATHSLEDALRSLGSAQSALPSDKVSVSQDKLNIAHDNAAISASKAGHSSLEYQQLLLNLARDTIQLEADQKTLGQTLAATASDFNKAKTAALQLASATEAGTKPRRFGETDLGSPVSQQQQLQQRATQSYVSGIQQVIATSSGLTAVQEHNLLLLEQYAQAVGKIPTKAQTTLILDNKSATLTLNQFLDEIEGLPVQTAAESAAAGKQIVADINDGVLASAGSLGLKGLVQNEINDLGSLVPAAEQQGEAVGGAFFSGFAQAISEAEDIGKSAATQLAADKQLAQTVDPLKTQLADDKQSLADLQTQATDAATQGAQDLANAIQSAKQNLDTIGQDIADSLATYIDKPLTDAATRISDAQAKLSLLNDQVSLSRLGEEVVLPGNRRLSSNPATAISQLEALQKAHPNDSALAQYILQFRSLALQVEGDSNQIKQNSANLVTTAAKTRLANLTDLFNTGQISEGTLQRDITSLLEKNGLTAKTARTRGASFADTLAAQLAGVGQQADALKGFGNGSGLIPSITRPLDTLNATQKTLAGIASSERAKQLSESKTQTTILKDIHAAQVANTFTNSLSRNPGVGNNKSKRLVGTGN